MCNYCLTNTNLFSTHEFLSMDEQICNSQTFGLEGEKFVHNCTLWFTSTKYVWLEFVPIFPELHFTALCWIHSSGNSSWMFHHRPDPWGWYNPLITHTHSWRGTFTSCMRWIWESTVCHFICSGSNLIAYSMGWDTNMMECQDRRWR